MDKFRLSIKEFHAEYSSGSDPGAGKRRMSAADYRAQVAGTIAAAKPLLSSNKYSNEAVVVDGQRFDSKLEARRYERLMLLKAAGEVNYVVRQVRFWIGHDCYLYVDFQIFWADGRVTYEDTKGVMTANARTKIKSVEARYPITIEIVTKSNVGR